MKKTKVKFNVNALREELTKNLVEEQTRRLIMYAEEKIKEIGDKINSYPRANHMDRTGNLLNSLCWGVAYDNDLKASGFYRNASSTKLSYLHERYEESKAYPVDGHAEAEKYIRMYGKLGSGGGTWRVWFAVLAPYWGYWEEGFTMVHGGYDPEGKRWRKFRGASFMRFAVMSQFYDKVTQELKPAKVTYKTSSPKYSKASLRKDYNTRFNYPYSKFNKKWENDKRYDR